jgi:septal ring factor EnvC (AmiA/AmiB activator)
MSNSAVVNSLLTILIFCIAGDKAKRDALKREITALKDQIEDIEIALSTAMDKGDKYSAAASSIPDTINRISVALAKGPKVLQPVLTDVFRNVCFLLSITAVCILRFCYFVGAL